MVYKTSDGITFTTVSGAPLGKYWTQFQQRVYCAGVEADSDVLHWSSIGDLTNWSMVAPSDSNSLTIDRFSGGTIQNIEEINDRVVIFKRRKIKRWDENYLRTVMSSHGLQAPYSLAEMEGMAFTLDSEGIRLYDGNYPKKISLKIEDLVQGISYSATNIPRICGEVLNDKYYLSVGDITDENGNTISNAMIVYDYVKNLWWLYSLSHHMTAIMRFLSYDGIERIYCVLIS